MNSLSNITRKETVGNSWKLTLVLLVLVAAGLGLFRVDSNVSASDNMAASIFLEPASQNVSINGTATIAIRLKNVVNLYAAEVHLSFPADLLEVQDSDANKDGIQIAPAIGLFPFVSSAYYVVLDIGKKYYYSYSDNTGGYFIAQAEASADNVSGNISYAITLLNPYPPVSAGSDGRVLATISFRCKARGTANITFANPVAGEPPVKLADATGSPVPLASGDIHGAIIQSALPGDANSDGLINALDITKVERIIGGLDAATHGADANQDGKINALDITKTERKIVGLD